MVKPWWVALEESCVGGRGGGEVGQGEGPVVGATHSPMALWCC